MQATASAPAGVRYSGGAAIEEAASTFAADYGPGPGAPVVVVIAAFDEAPTVASVVASVPRSVGDLDVECLVVDDGSTDGTSGQARASGALVCRIASNVGQGRALRLGYRLAIDRGCRVIATMDADGQFVPGELERLVEPVTSGRADLASGSRRLGRAEGGDVFRRGGLFVYGALVSLLTGERITDPANGFRAFRPEVAATVPLRQAQYQTAELLIGTLARGFTVEEVPVTVLPRAAGISKKGANLAYGHRFGRVVLSTWWRSRAVRAGLRGGFKPKS